MFLMTQQIPNITRYLWKSDIAQPSAHHKATTHLVISVCQILEHSTEAQRKLEAFGNVHPGMPEDLNGAQTL